jgi:DNA recombination protein RmuC
MTNTLIVLQILTLVALIVLLLRRSTPAVEAVDPRLAQLLSADLPGQIARLDALMDSRSESLNQHLRGELSGLRTDSAAASGQLRTELLQTLDTLSRTLRTELLQKLDASRQENETAAERLRSRVQEGLQQLSSSNEKKLEEMRLTVDEKLHATLQNRLTESFGQVTDQLTKVHAGLGEMTKLSAGVDDLSRIFTNVKSRGGIGELALEMLLKDRLAPSQYVRNAKVKPNTQEIVEFAVKFPTPQGEMLLPIDSKFPREIFERLENAYENGTDVVSAGKAFEAAIRFEGKKICEKYIAPPTTTSFAIMFLPTESLYAEVIRRDGLQADIQQNCHVTIAGPSTLSAILTSFQMGFHMLQLQQKGDEVWKVLANARKEFGTFETLMDKMTADVGRVQGTIDKLGVRTRAINRTLRDVSMDAGETRLASGSEGAFDGFLPMLAASNDE